MNTNKIEILSKLICLLLYLSLILGFYLNENLAGGAIADFNIHIPILNAFKENYLLNFLRYKDYGYDHSPFFFSFLNFINFPLNNLEFSFNSAVNFEGTQLKIFGTKFTALRLLYLHICLLAPIMFYKCLRIRYSDCNKFILLILSSLILLSPYFRSYAIWPGYINLGFVFLLCSIYFFLKLEIETVNKKKIVFILLNVLFLALSAHAAPIYSLISLYFFYKIYEKFKFSNELLIFIIFNILLATPAFYYFFILDQYPFIYGINFFDNPTTVLYSTNIILISTIILFYTIPFIVVNKDFFYKEIFTLNRSNFLIFVITLTFTLLLIFNFYYDNKMNGGGFFYEASNIIFNNNFLLYIVAFFSIFILLKIIIKNKINDIILILLLFTLDPDPWVFHKTYDPLLLVIFLLLFQDRLFKSLNKNNQNIFALIFFIYFTSIYILYFYIRIIF